MHLGVCIFKSLIVANAVLTLNVLLTWALVNWCVVNIYLHMRYHEIEQVSNIWLHSHKTLYFVINSTSKIMSCASIKAFSEMFLIRNYSLDSVKNSTRHRASRKLQLWLPKVSNSNENFRFHACKQKYLVFYTPSTASDLHAVLVYRVS